MAPRSSPSKEALANIDEAIYHLGGFGRCQHLVVAVACFLWTTHSMKAMSLVYVNPEFGGDVRELSRSLFFFGWIIGLFFWGSFARNHGWLRALIVAQVLSAIFGMCDAMAQSGTGYSLSWLAGGFAQGAILTCSFSYANDFLPPSHRARGGGLIQLGFPLGVLFVTLLAYCLSGESWRTLSATCSLAGLPAVAVAAAYLPESPRWLHDSGSRRAFLAGARRLALINRLPMPGDSFRVLGPAHGKGKDASAGSPTPGSPARAPTRAPCAGGCFEELCSSPQLRRTTLALCVIWSSSSAVGFGISFDTGRLYGKDLVHAVMAAGPLLQLPAILVATKALESWGRLPTMRCVLLLAAASCFALALASSIAPLPAVIGDEISEVARWSDRAAQAGAEATRIDHLWRVATRWRRWSDLSSEEENQAEEHAAKAAAELAAVQARKMAQAAAAASAQLERDKNSLFLFLVSMVSVLASAVGRASASVAMNMVYILSAELWPTEVRPIGMMAGSMAARFGGAMSPVLLWELQSYSPGSSYVVFGLVCLCGVGALWHLPEARGCGTLETANDLHALIEAQRLQSMRRGEANGMSRQQRSRKSYGGSELEESMGDDDDDVDDDDDDAPLLARHDERWVRRVNI